MVAIGLALHIHSKGDINTSPIAFDEMTELENNSETSETSKKEKRRGEVTPSPHHSSRKNKKKRGTVKAESVSINKDALLEQFNIGPEDLNLVVLPF